ncbi:MAG TPA: PilZ domain-containing protein [Kofleriaceae bacterium]|nr:PilZ domain-containing protein [Kofleriaceae bacterium]
MPPSPPPPPGSERRRSPRFEVLAQVELRRGDGEVVILPVANISAGGVLLRIEPGMLLRGLRVGDPVGVYVDLGGEVSFDVDAEVVRVDLLGGPGREPGIALMWTSTDPAFATTLARVLEAQARR